MTQADTPRTAPQTKVTGLMAEFDSPDALLSAAGRVRQAGYTKTDAFSPFPIHGIDEVLGIRPTGLPWLVLIAGIIGGLAAIFLELWTNSIDYPMLISGKPLFSLPTAIPVAFELTILAGGTAAFLGMLALNQLPRLANPLFRKPSFLRVTTDRFFLLIEAADPKFDAAATRQLLESLQPLGIEVCEEETGHQPLPKFVVPALLLMGCLALIPPALIARARVTKSDKPRLDTFPDMDYHPGFKPQTAAPARLFADRRSNRPPVLGTVPRGSLNADDRLHRGIDPEADNAALHRARTSAMFTATADEDAGTETETDAGPAPEAEADEDTVADADAEAKADPDSQPAADDEPQPAWVTEFPLPVTRELMARGRQRYDIYCSACHGLVGDGGGIVSRRALALEQGTWIPPLSLHVESVVQQPVGQLYHTVTHGVRSMPGYGDQLKVEDRWAIVLYIRALQRSRGASPADVPSEMLDTLRDL
jgi:mono/diheme cytochrome c family protein